MTAEAIAPELDAQGNTVERDDKGNIVRITNPKGKTYEARHLSMRAGAELVKRVEAYRWANQMTVAEVVEEALNKLLDAEGVK